MTMFRGDEDFDNMERRPASGGGGAVTWLLLVMLATIVIGMFVAWVRPARSEENDKLMSIACLPDTLPKLELPAKDQVTLDKLGISTGRDKFVTGRVTVLRTGERMTFLTEVPVPSGMLMIYVIDSDSFTQKGRAWRRVPPFERCEWEEFPI